MIEGRIRTCYAGQLVLFEGGDGILDGISLEVDGSMSRYLSVGFVQFKEDSEKPDSEEEVWIEQGRVPYYYHPDIFFAKELDLTGDEAKYLWCAEFSKTFLNKGLQVAIITESNPYKYADIKRVIDVILNAERYAGE